MTVEVDIAKISERNIAPDTRSLPHSSVLILLFAAKTNKPTIIEHCSRLHVVKNFDQYIQPLWHDSGVWRTDGPSSDNIALCHKITQRAAIIVLYRPPITSLLKGSYLWTLLTATPYENFRTSIMVFLLLARYVPNVAKRSIWDQCKYHRLRGSASPVLTATHHSYGSLAWLSDFFPAQP